MVVARFFYLHALVSDDDVLRDAGFAFLGDRIRVEGVSVHDGVITVAQLDRLPDAPFSEPPSVPVIRQVPPAGRRTDAAARAGRSIRDSLRRAAPRLPQRRETLDVERHPERWRGFPVRASRPQYACTTPVRILIFRQAIRMDAASRGCDSGNRTPWADGTAGTVPLGRRKGDEWSARRGFELYESGTDGLRRFVLKGDTPRGVPVQRPRPRSRRRGPPAHRGGGLQRRCHGELTGGRGGGASLPPPAPPGGAKRGHGDSPPFVNALEGGAVTARRVCGQAGRSLAKRPGGSLAEHRAREREEVLGATVGPLVPGAGFRPGYWPGASLPSVATLRVPPGGAGGGPCPL